MGCCGYNQTIDEINQRNKIQPQQQEIKEVPNTIQPQQQQTTLLYRNDYCYDEEDIEKINKYVSIGLFKIMMFFIIKPVSI